MNGTEQRAYWLAMLQKIAAPVLENLARRELKASMPVVYYQGDRREFAHLEALGRLACGIAPWLELEGLTGEEETARARCEALLLEGIDAATDPASPDYMNFERGGQPLVDAAFLSHALVRAPKHLAGGLHARVRGQLIAALKKTRQIVPGNSNWIFFSAMVEGGLYVLGDPEYDRVRVSYAIRQFQQWYKGDGVYGDGPDFHWDYYNSFVIQPMLVDLIEMFRQDDPMSGEAYPAVLRRAQRYASVLEKMISPEGTYPILGRSITYRCGVFQLLGQAALEHFLADDLAPAQVRCALTAVMRRVLEAPGTFDESGWLRHGVCGFQPGLAERYICTGSLYLCASVFLPLGLAPSDPFWSAPNEKWSSQRVFGGEDFPADHCI